MSRSAALFLQLLYFILTVYVKVLWTSRSSNIHLIDQSKRTIPFTAIVLSNIVEKVFRQRQNRSQTFLLQVNSIFLIFLSAGFVPGLHLCYPFKLNDSNNIARVSMGDETPYLPSVCPISIYVMLCYVQNRRTDGEL